MKDILNKTAEEDERAALFKEAQRKAYRRLLKEIPYNNDISIEKGLCLVRAIICVIEEEDDL